MLIYQRIFGHWELVVHPQRIGKLGWLRPRNKSGDFGFLGSTWNLGSPWRTRDLTKEKSDPRKSIKLLDRKSVWYDILLYTSILGTAISMICEICEAISQWQGFSQCPNQEIYGWSGKNSWRLHKISRCIASQNISAENSCFNRQRFFRSGLNMVFQHF